MPIGAVVKLCDSGQIQVVDDEGNVSPQTIEKKLKPWLDPHPTTVTSSPPAPPPTGALDLPSERHQHQADAPDLHPRRGGHDPPGRPERSRNPPKPAHQIPREAHLRECGSALLLVLRPARGRAHCGTRKRK